LPYWTTAPFVLLLLGIAMLPLFAGRWWHRNLNKAIVALGLALPVAIYLLAIDGKTNGESTHRLVDELWEYAAFIILLAALYTIAGGILLIGDIRALPRTNTLFLALGAVLANFIGTTGASIVLIRPLLRINLDRQRKSHLPIFFIYIVSNTGGLLTPVGDPPLFLGFLQGVDFFWTLRLWREWLLVNGLLLTIFWIWDSAAYRKETPTALQRDATAIHPLRLRGLWINGPLMLGVLSVVVLHSDAVGNELGRALGVGNISLHRPWGEIAIVSLTVLSLLLTPGSVRRGNQFSWGPMIEVAVLFLGIFVTMVPALALLRAHGSELNITRPWQFFLLTGLLSGFLDNAPTYLTFATLASGENTVGWLSVNRPEILAAISCGAVFMGAMTYIGNGPNFMVKAIAESHRYKMPSFFGHLAYSMAILAPVFAIVTFMFF
jgi:Na+/H+ antiporter NhaD/arsenite permease-like protein